MSLYLASLNSGSNGNCYYVGNEHEAVLVDAGLSCRETELRMKALRLDIGKLKALFISHEHSDHIRGMYRLAARHKLPVFITPSTRAACRVTLPPELLHSFQPEVPVPVGSLSILPFSKHHDACEPHSFVVCSGDIKVGILTDIGQVCKRVQHHFSQCHAVFLESNYDEAMLENGRYPWHLKNRIRGGAGHLSNGQALELFLHHRAAHLRLVILAHLSQENNTPERALENFRPHAGDTEIAVASRYGPSAVYRIGADTLLHVETNVSEAQGIRQSTLF
ncbi:MAG: MBL fold metallo-hydrolase [Bacteroidetes bacterium]|nr:MBL fold metallo-hydrolase [Bacteroidota bacterium]MBS1628982.1 MBL fold metallo-hydrolase [Bacteroidota bacterium]